MQNGNASGKIYLYYFDPLKPYFYIAKRGLTEVYIIFSNFCSKHRLWILVGTASFYLIFFFSFLMVKFSVYWNGRFRNGFMGSFLSVHRQVYPTGSR